VTSVESEAEMARRRPAVGNRRAEGLPRRGTSRRWDGIVTCKVVGQA
jgi:hypothetical protein